MKDYEVFNLATWNFLLGQRDVEDILRDPGVKSLVIRGGIGAALPTIAAIRDLDISGWKDFPAREIHTPLNALSSADPPLEEKMGRNEFFKRLLKRTYGVNLAQGYENHADQIVVLVDDLGEDGELLQRAEEAISKAGVSSTVFVVPTGRKIPAVLRKYALDSLSTGVWDGLNVFFPANIEEAVTEAEPERILLIGKEPERLFYSCIGAVDYFIIQDARFRNPASLKLWDILELGKRVSVIFPNGRDNSADSGEDLMANLAARHLREYLGVTSTLPDYQFSPVPEHKIAIDLM